jgi:TatD DNase family protein
MSFFIDHHCHLDFPEFVNDLQELKSNCKKNNIKYFLSAGTKISKFDKLLEIANANKEIFCSVGIHPHYAGQEKCSIEEILELTKHKKVIGIGECGLDYHYKNSSKEEQTPVFKSQIEVARLANLPVIIHTRSADDDTIKILQEEYEKGAFSGVIHCYSTGLELAKKAVELGLYVSVSGIATFPKSHELRNNIIQAVPLDRLLIETDAPYLAPVPYRGKKNNPAYLVETAKVLADLYDVSLDEMAKKTTNNFKKLYDKAGL